MPTLAVPTDQIADFCRRHGIRSLALFGSFLHGDADEDSDVDLLFEMEPGRRIRLLALSGMAQELSALLGRRVDFVPREGLKPGLRDEVLSEAQVLYSAETGVVLGGEGSGRNRHGQRLRGDDVGTVNGLAEQVNVPHFHQAVF